MRSLELLNDLVFGDSGILKNEYDFLSTEIKIESDKNKTSQKLPFENNSVFKSLNLNDGISFLSTYYSKEYKTIESGNVFSFQTKIDIILKVFYDEFSHSINTWEVYDTLKIKKSIRWYLFEVNKIAFSLKGQFILVFKNGLIQSNDLLIDASNYLILNYLRYRLIQLYCYLIHIDEPRADLYISNDNLLHEVINSANIGNAVLGLLSRRINLKTERNIFISNQFYSFLKSQIEYEEKNKFDLDEESLDLISSVENKEFFDWASFGGLISDESDLYDIPSINAKFDFIYRYISDKALQYEFLSDRLNFIENIIDTIKHFLDDNPNFKYRDLNDTVPRRLIRLLQSDYDTLKANPKIDLQVLDRNKIKAIKLNLTVSQLALLFRLFEENDLINLDISKTEYYNTISKAFSTKRSSTISSNALGNDYVQPNKKDYDFWKDKFLELARKSKFHN